MNNIQHGFVWVGICLITFMAVALDNTLFWLVAAVALISECVLLCKNEKLDDKKWALLVIVIICFVLLFIAKDIQEEIRVLIGFSQRPFKIRTRL